MCAILYIDVSNLFDDYRKIMDNLDKYVFCYIIYNYDVIIYIVHFNNVIIYEKNNNETN
jgi:hypothetical protein